MSLLQDILRILSTACEESALPLFRRSRPAPAARGPVGSVGAFVGLCDMPAIPSPTTVVAAAFSRCCRRKPARSGCQATHSRFAAQGPRPSGVGPATRALPAYRQCGLDDRLDAYLAILSQVRRESMIDLMATKVSRGRQLTVQLGLAAVLVCWLPAAAAAQDRQANPQRFRIATRQVPPFAMKNEDGQWVGISIELLREIKAELDRRRRTSDRADLRRNGPRSNARGCAERRGGPGRGGADGQLRAREADGLQPSLLQFGAGNRRRWPQCSRLGWRDVGPVLAHLLESRGGPVCRPADQWRGRVLLRAATQRGFRRGDDQGNFVGDLVGRRHHDHGRLWRQSSQIRRWTIHCLSLDVLRSVRHCQFHGCGDFRPDRDAAPVANCGAQRICRAYAWRPWPDPPAKTTCDRVTSFPAKKQPTCAPRCCPCKPIRSTRSCTTQPILRYEAHQNFPGEIHVLSSIFERQDYAFALPTNSPLRERVNQALLRKIGSPEWKSRAGGIPGRTVRVGNNKTDNWPLHEGCPRRKGGRSCSGQSSPRHHPKAGVPTWHAGHRRRCPGAEDSRHALHAERRDRRRRD